MSWGGGEVDIKTLLPTKSETANYLLQLILTDHAGKHIGEVFSSEAGLHLSEGAAPGVAITFSLVPIAKDTLSKSLLQKKNDLMCQLAMRKKGQSKDTNPQVFPF